jgi:hypothetical protein
MSQSSIQRLFREYLEKAPIVAIKHKIEASLLIDATYFPNDICLVVYYQSDIKYTQLYRLTDNEYFIEIKEDLENIRNLGIHVKSVTCDGHRAILKSVKKVFPNAQIQRCLVHVKRQSRIWLTQKPKTTVATDLLKIINKLTAIKTIESANSWIISLNSWYEENKLFLEQKTYNPATGNYWYKHKMIRRTMTLIQKALPDLFRYLYDPDIPATTNRIEGFFSHLKEKLQIHRGLTKQSKKNFIKWYLYFMNNTR